MNFLGKYTEYILGLLIAVAVLSIVYFVKLPGLILLLVIPLASIFMPAKSLSIVGIALIIVLALAIFLTGNESALSANVSKLLLGAVVGILVQALKPSDEPDEVPKQTTRRPSPNQSKQPVRQRVRPQSPEPAASTAKSAVKRPGHAPSMQTGFNLDRKQPSRPSQPRTEQARSPQPQHTLGTKPSRPGQSILQAKSTRTRPPAHSKKQPAPRVLDLRNKNPSTTPPKRQPSNHTAPAPSKPLRLSTQLTKKMKRPPRKIQL